MNGHEKDRSVRQISRSLCSGCMMCGDICPRRAISFPVTKGFWYPDVDAEACVNCGLCSRRCPVLNVQEANRTEPLACYGCKSKDEFARWHSTSGGFFSELAQRWIAEGGVVAGAAYGERQEIIHIVGSDRAAVERLRQSKYAQSRTTGIYEETKRLLDRGEKVLFCGAPCQVEALLHFLGGPDEKLLTMDFVCLGICSPYAYRRYLDMLERKYHSKVKRVWFKNKELGWRQIAVRIDFENGKEYLRNGGMDLFMVPFVTDALSMRPNCENCRFRKLPHRSDIMVGDFWGVEKVHPAVDDDKGISAVLLNSQKGLEIYQRLERHLVSFKTTCADIVSGNFSILKPLATNPDQEAFMDAIETKGYERAVYRYSSLTRRKILLRKLRGLLRPMKRLGCSVRRRCARRSAKGRG